MGNWKAPADLKYTKSDEWVRVSGGTAEIGLSDYAQDSLNDIVYLELPEVGDSFDQGAAFGSVESVKAQSDISMPIGGKVTEINSAAADSPEAVNTDPYGSGWMVELRPEDPAALDGLLTADDYRALVEKS